MFLVKEMKGRKEKVFEDFSSGGMRQAASNEAGLDPLQRIRLDVHHGKRRGRYHADAWHR
jgi:hypothetical protein